jgi:hypothetical protein
MPVLFVEMEKTKPKQKNSKKNIVFNNQWIKDKITREVRK